MAFHVLYYFSVKPSKETEFRESWSQFASEIRSNYGENCSALFRTPSGQYISFAKAPSKEAWASFWLTKELLLEMITRIKSSLSEPTQPVELQLVHMDLPNEVSSPSQ